MNRNSFFKKAGKDRVKIKTDCFAFKEGKCVALKKLYCEFEICNFYKRGKEMSTSEQGEA